MPIRLASLAAALFLLTVSEVQQVMPEPSQELAEIHQRLAKAWVAADRAAIERIIAPDWTATGADGRVSTRGDVLRDAFETNVHRMTAIEWTMCVSECLARRRSSQDVPMGGAHGNVPYDVTIRFTDVFVRREGRWQAVASHASLLTPPKQ
jgi:hypothetical protein